MNIETQIEIDRINTNRKRMNEIYILIAQLNDWIDHSKAKDRRSELNSELIPLENYFYPNEPDLIY